VRPGYEGGGGGTRSPSGGERAPRPDGDGDIDPAQRPAGDGDAAKRAASDSVESSSSDGKDPSDDGVRTLAPRRSGSRLAGAAVRNVYRSADDQYVAVSCGSPRQLSQVAELVAPGRDVGLDELDNLLAAWIAERLVADAITELLAQRLPVVRVNDAHALLADEHAIARQAIVRVTSAERGSALVVAPTPKFDRTPARPLSQCPELGADNNDLLGRLRQPLADPERSI
jgi:crotonobetainyl-CoA:carnitine CoA-transferase CaiB-like acyl-CoA transferase